MIARAAVDRLRGLRSAHSAVVSVYLPVPLDLAGHRGLATKARELVKAAAGDAAARSPGGRASAGPVSDADLAAITRAVATRGHDWLGHTIAMFACAELGLFELAPLPGHRAELAVVAARPHTRPLLAALQRNPAYLVAVIDTKHAWIIAVADDSIETLAERTGEQVASHGFSGWYGLETYRVQQRVIQLARRHFRDTIAVLERADDGAGKPLVIGGHESEVNQFLAILPAQVRRSVAGSFHVDIATLTPARVRELAAPVIARWVELSEAKLVADVLGQPRGTAVATDLAGCVAAVRSRAVAELVVADDQLVSGFVCDDCGAMSAGRDGCGCGDDGCRAVPDLLDELASRALDDAGVVTSVRGAPFAAAARLRWPVEAAAAAG